MNSDNDISMYNIPQYHIPRPTSSEAPTEGYLYPQSVLSEAPVPAIRTNRLPHVRASNEHDSGVDIEGIHPEVSSDIGSTHKSSTHSVQSDRGIDLNPNPGMRGRPDSVLNRHGNHDYEELPHARLYKEGAHEYSYTDKEKEGRPSSNPPRNSVKKMSLGGSTENLCSPNNSVIDRNSASSNLVYRKKLNPLYDSADHEEVPTKDHHSVSPCFIVLVIFIGVVALAALVLSLLLLTGATGPEVRTTYLVSPGNISLNEALDKLETLSNNYAVLLEKYEKLKEETQNNTVKINTVSSEIDIGKDAQNVTNARLQSEINGVQNEVARVTNKTTKLNSQQDVLNNLNENLRNELNQLDTSQNQLNISFSSVSGQLQSHLVKYNTLTTDMTQLREDLQTQEAYSAQTRSQLVQANTTLHTQFNALSTTLTEQVENVSKMQGPPGVGNLTACFQDSVTRTHSGSVPPIIYSPELPRAEDQGWVILGMECSSVNAVSAVLQISGSGSSKKFKCMCGSQMDTGNNNRACTLYYWKCPALS